MKVSVIIPAYNSENYIARCLDSLIEQDEKNFEVIVINDGSKDNTSKIVEEYANKDSRIILINKENGGVSSARNVGLDNAKGEYIFFVDSDDYLPSDALSDAVKSIETSGVDIVMAKMWHCDNNTGSLREHDLQEPLLECAINPQTENSFLKILTGYALKKGVAYSTLAKLYKKEIVDKYSIRFNEELSYCEDVLFNIDYLKNAKSACVRDYCYYNAEENILSISILQPVRNVCLQSFQE